MFLSTEVANVRQFSMTGSIHNPRSLQVRVMVAAGLLTPPYVQGKEVTTSALTSPQLYSPRVMLLTSSGQKAVEMIYGETVLRVLL